MKHLLIVSFLCAVSTSANLLAADDGFIPIYNGKDLTGWESNEKENTWTVENGSITGHGNRNHLYYMEELQNFELKIDVKINRGGNSGVYVKAPWVKAAWPVSGFELQVNNSNGDSVKTGSLYNIIKLSKAPHGDDEWFTYHIICKGDTLTVAVNGQELYKYVDPMEKGGAPQNDKITEQNKRISQKGHIALQQHDPKSKVEFKNIILKKLP